MMAEHPLGVFALSRAHGGKEAAKAGICEPDFF